MTWGHPIYFSGSWVRYMRTNCFEKHQFEGIGKPEVEGAMVNYNHRCCEFRSRIKLQNSLFQPSHINGSGRAYCSCFGHNIWWGIPWHQPTWGLCPQCFSDPTHACRVIPHTGPGVFQLGIYESWWEYKIQVLKFPPRVFHIVPGSQSLFPIPLLGFPRRNRSGPEGVRDGPRSNRWAGSRCPVSRVGTKWFPGSPFYCS